MYVSVPQESQKDPVSLQESDTVEPRLTNTSLNTVTFSCFYYSHFILAQGITQSVIFLFKEPL